MAKKVKHIVIVVVLMLVSFTAGVIFMACKSPNMYNPDLLRNKMQQEAEATKTKLLNNIAELTEKLADANNTILAQGALIHKYETHDLVESEVSYICKMRAQLFACAETEIHVREENPVCFGTTNWQIGKLNMTKTEEDITARYYFAVYSDKISVENIEDKKIEISYTKSSFMGDVPYDIISRKTEENLGAKILNSYSNDTIHVTVASEGRKLLSQAEDEFVRQLKEEYAGSEIPVYVNGKSLNSWSDKDKVIKA